jgi:hypothetical protein
MSALPPATLLSDILDSHLSSFEITMSETFMHLWAELGWREGTLKYPKLSHAFLQMEKLRAGWTDSQIATFLVTSGLDTSDSDFRNILRYMNEDDIGPTQDAFNFVEGLPKLKLWTDEVAQGQFSRLVYMALLEYFNEVQDEGVAPDWEDFHGRPKYTCFP